MSRREPSASFPECGHTVDGVTCRERGPHLCETRAEHVRMFFAEVLVHTKGRYARKPFVLTVWQWSDIIRPLFGEVVWSDEFDCYVRRYRIAWIELGRKNGKSELLAGIMLYLLVADGEESAELYGVARDKKQAGLVFDVAARMVQLSPILSKRLDVKKHNRRIVDPKMYGTYEVIAADEMGALGSNPHGVAADEILAWRDRGMWDSMRTGMGSGARIQPMMVAATTAGTRSTKFALETHEEMARIAEDQSRSPHIFVFMRNAPDDADPWDEANWFHPNPALGDFLSLNAMREEALEAKNNPAQENAFRQFRLNQWVSQTSRWMPMHLWDECSGDVWLSPEHGREALAGRIAWFGFDLAAKFDLTAWCLLVPDPDDDMVDMLWRFWLPEDALPALDRDNDGVFTRWVRDGWITVTEGNVLDYERVYADVASDAEHFHLVAGDGDQWSMAPAIQQVQARTGIEDVLAYNNTYANMTGGMNELMALVKQQRIRHHSNPVAKFCFEAVEIVKAPYNPELIRPHKPERDGSRFRIDAVPTAAMACNAWKRAPLQPQVDHRVIVRR